MVRKINRHPAADSLSPQRDLSDDYRDNSPNPAHVRRLELDRRIAEYWDLSIDFGHDSDQAREFIQKHKDDAELLQAVEDIRRGDYGYSGPAPNRN